MAPIRVIGPSSGLVCQQEVRCLHDSNNHVDVVLCLNSPFVLLASGNHGYELQGIFQQGSP